MRRAITHHLKAQLRMQENNKTTHHIALYCSYLASLCTCTTCTYCPKAANHAISPKTAVPLVTKDGILPLFKFRLLQTSIDVYCIYNNRDTWIEESSHRDYPHNAASSRDHTNRAAGASNGRKPIDFPPIWMVSLYALFVTTRKSRDQVAPSDTIYQKRVPI